MSAMLVSACAGKTNQHDGNANLEAGQHDGNTSMEASQRSGNAGLATAQRSGNTDGTAEGMTFSRDSAMAYLAAQVGFGQRVPGTPAHDACRDYLVETLQQAGATVSTHTATVTAWNGDILPLTNIIARLDTAAPGMPVMLVAHWDTRPWADAQFPGSDARRPIDGANDGASGVAVLLETARLIKLVGASRPVTILLVDGEDYGAPEHVTPTDDTWCLGTQRWIADGGLASLPPHEWGILLDMVGGENAIFHQEQLSAHMARPIVDMVWAKAASLGLSDRFPQQKGGAITDDHLYLNRAGLPTIDIIEHHNPVTGSFNPTWHTLDDNIEHIDPATLQAVGTLVSSLVLKQ